LIYESIIKACGGGHVGYAWFRASVTNLASWLRPLTLCFLSVAIMPPSIAIKPLNVISMHLIGRSRH